MFKLRLPHRDKVVAVIDIASGTVGVALAAMPSRGPARVIAEARTLITLENEDVKHSVALISERVDSIVKRLHETVADFPAVTEAYCIIHAPWARSKTVRLRKDFERDTKIEESMISDLAKTIANDEKDINMSQLLEASIFRTWVNGYPVRNAEGKIGHSISIASILSDADSEVRSSAEAAIHRAFPVARILWRSGMHAQLSVLSRTKVLDHSYLIADVGVDATHLVSVREGMVVAERVVPEGLRTILARVGSGRPPEETLGFMRMLGRDACDSAACEAVQKALAVAEPDLVRAFGEATGTLATPHRIANDLVLIAHADMAGWLSQFFMRIDFSQFTVTALPFAVIPWTASEMTEWVQSTSPIDSALATGIALAHIESRE